MRSRKAFGLATERSTTSGRRAGCGRRGARQGGAEGGGNADIQPDLKGGHDTRGAWKSRMFATLAMVATLGALAIAGLMLGPARTGWSAAEPIKIGEVGP